MTTAKVRVGEGDPAPTFTLPRDGGGEVSLQEALRQGNVVLYFYPKDDTSGCTTEAIDFTARLEAFAAVQTQVFGISPDPVKKHDRFKEKHNLAVTLLADEDKGVLEAYGVWVQKSMYGRKYMGVERSTFLIDESGKIVRAWRKVRVKGHVDEVLQAARELREKSSAAAG